MLDLVRWLTIPIRPFWRQECELETGERSDARRVVACRHPVFRAALISRICLPTQGGEADFRTRATASGWRGAERTLLTSDTRAYP